MSDACLDSGPNIALTLVGDPPALHAEPIFSADAEQGLIVSPNGDGVWAPRRPPVISPPIGSGASGWERYVDVGSNRVWAFMYTNGMWNCVGGPDLFSLAESGGSFGADSNAAWHSLGTPPTITIPMSLTYKVSWGGTVSAGEDSHATQLGLSIGGGNPGTDDVCQTGTLQAVSISRQSTFSINSGTVLTLKGKGASTSGSNVFNHIWIAVQAVHS